MSSLRSRLMAPVGRYVDRRTGVETAGRVTEEELGYDRRVRDGYEPSRWLGLPLALPARHVGAGEVFVDLGSGKGRVVIQAAWRYPFERVIGVELSPQLSAAARANLEASRHRLRCRKVELVTADATGWEVPDDLTIVYLYNPFRGEVFSRAMERLVDMVDRRAAPLRLIYVNAVEHVRLMATGRAVELPAPADPLLRLAGFSPGAIRRYELRPGR